jgi:hypothetical protein
MNTFKNFFLKSTDESSKRLNGTIGYLAATLVICIFKQEFIPELLYTSAALLGLGILDKIGGTKA